MWVQAGAARGRGTAGGPWTSPGVAGGGRGGRFQVLRTAASERVGVWAEAAAGRGSGPARGEPGPRGLGRALTGRRARSCAPGRAGSGQGQGRGPGRGRPRREPHRGRPPTTHPTATSFRLRRASQRLTGSRGRAGGGGPSSPPAWPEALPHPVAMGTRPPPG